MPGARTTRKQKRLSATLAFIASYDGGPANARRSKRVGRRRVKRRSARLGRLDAQRTIAAEQRDPGDEP